MTKAATKPRSAPADAIFARVSNDGAFIAADDHSAAMLRKKGIKRGELVRMTVKRMTDARGHHQWRKVHGLGTVISINIEEFEKFQLINGAVDSHGAIKWLQFLSGVECDEMMATLEDGTEILCRTARSLAFDKMGAERFDLAYKGFCAYLRSRWWSTLQEWQLEEMVRLVE